MSRILMKYLPPTWIAVKVVEPTVNGSGRVPICSGTGLVTGWPAYFIATSGSGMNNRGAPASPHNAEPATRPQFDDCFSLREFEPADEQQRPGVAADAGLVFLAKVSDLFGVALVFGL
jgi:hypothetical protein